MSDPRRALALAVCLKFTVDVNQLRPDPATGAPDLARARWRVSDFDENALEEALRLRERHGGRIVALSLVEQEPPRDVLLRPLAAGADALYLVTHPAAGAGDASLTATLLAAALSEVASRLELPAWDLLLCGDASCDGFGAQVGPRIAEALGLVPITHATRVEVEGERVVATRTIEDVVHEVEADLPVVLTVGAETNKPRLPHLREIMDAGRKRIERLSLADLGRDDLAALRPAVELLRVVAPPSARRRLRVDGDGPDELARDLVRRLLAAGELTP